MSSSKVLLQDSIVGLVPLNWKYSPEIMDSFLSRISGYGFRGIQISADQAQSADFLTTMAKYEVRKAEHYIAIRCDREGPLPGTEEETAESVRVANAAGVEMLVFAVDGSDERDRHAGRVFPDIQFVESGYQRLAEQIEKYARQALSLGMKSSFHPHAATFIETPEETKSLMDLMSPEIVGLCLDVGHWIVGGGDPVAAVAQYADRVTHVHVKDVSKSVLTDMLNGKYATMHDAVVDGKLFVPAGTGILNLVELFTSLNSVNFRGWLMSEQDSAYEPSEEASGVSIKNMSAALGSN